MRWSAFQMESKPRSSAILAITTRSLHRAVTPPISRSVSGKMSPTFNGRRRVTLAVSFSGMAWSPEDIACDPSHFLVGSSAGPTRHLIQQRQTCRCKRCCQRAVTNCLLHSAILDSERGGDVLWIGERAIRGPPDRNLLDNQLAWRRKPTLGFELNARAVEPIAQHSAAAGRPPRAADLDIVVTERHKRVGITPVHRLMQGAHSLQTVSFHSALVSHRHGFFPSAGSAGSGGIAFCSTACRLST